MIYLITGSSGFVGKHMVQYLLKINGVTKIICTYREKMGNHRHSLIESVTLNLNDKEKLFKYLKIYKPNYIIHLAAESSVGFSWKYPEISFRNNVNIYLNLIEGIRRTGIPCRLLSVGSSECYGPVNYKDLPLSENKALNPLSPYAVARVAQELLSKVYIEGYGLDIIMTRSFNHIGPNQDERFVIPSFINRILDRKNNYSKDPIETGDLTIIRDFLDVRDVVKAYSLLLLKGRSGETYNICSGQGIKLSDVLQMLSEIIAYPVTTKINSDYIRPNDNPIIIGDHSKLTSEVGWETSICIHDTLKDMISNQIEK